MVDIKSLLFTSPEKRVENIYAYLRERKFDRARQLVQNGLKEDANYPPYQTAHFELEAMEGRVAEARAVVERIHRAGGEAVQNLILRIEEIKGGVKGPYEYWDALAGCEIRKKEFGAAKEYLGRISESDAAALMKRYQGQCEKILHGPAEQIPLNAVHFYKVGLLGERMGRAAEAAEAFAAIARSTPTDAPSLAAYLEKSAANLSQKGSPLRFAAARIWAGVEKWQEAAQAYIVALRADPLSGPAVAQEVQALIPKHPKAPFLHAILYHAMLVQKKFPEAFAALEHFASSGASNRATAIQWLEAIREQAKGEPHFMLALGRLYLDAGDTEKAVFAFLGAKEAGADAASLQSGLGKLLEKDPRNAKAHEVLGDACFELKKFDLAARHYRHVAKVEGKRFTLIGKAAAMLEVDSGNADALLLLAELAKGEGQPGRMGVALRALLRGAPERAAEALEIATPPGAHPQAHLAAAESAALAGDYKRAFQQLGAFLTSHPGEARRAVLPMLLLAGKERSSIPKLMEMLERLTGSDASLMFALGEMSRLGGQATQAFQWYKKALAADAKCSAPVQEAMEALLREQPGLDALRFDLVDVYLQMNLPRQAGEQLERLMELAPKEMPRVVEKFKVLRERLPQDLAIGVACMRAQVLARMPKLAVKTASEILPLAKNDPEAMAGINLHLGRAYLMAGDCAKATPRFVAAFEQSKKLSAECGAGLQEVLAKEPAQAEALLGMSRLYAMENRLAEGLQCLENLWASAPAQAGAVLGEIEGRFAGFPMAAVLEAKIRLSEGDAEKAASALDRLSPEDKDELAAAAAWLAPAARKHPGDSALALLFGQVLACMGKADESALQLRRSVQQIPAMLPRARRAARQLLKTAPESLQPKFLAMHFARAAGAFQEALEMLESVPSCPAGQRAALEAEIRETAALVEHDGALTAALAHECLRLGFREDGLRLAGRALGHEGVPLAVLADDLGALLKAEPANAALLLQRAAICAAQSSWSGALDDLEKAVAAEPSERRNAMDMLAEIRRRSALGRAALMEADFALALGQWQHVLDLAKESPAAAFAPAERSGLFLRQGMALSRLGRPEEAEKSFVESYKHAPNLQAALEAVESFEARFVAERLQVLEASGRLDTFSAEEKGALREHADSSTVALLEKNGGPQALREVKSLCRAWLGNTAFALQLSESAGAHLRSAWLASRSHQWEKAMAHFEEAGRRDSGKSIQVSLRRAALGMVEEHLSKRPRVLMGASAFRRNPA